MLLCRSASVPAVQGTTAMRETALVSYCRYITGTVSLWGDENMFQQKSQPVHMNVENTEAGSVCLCFCQSFYLNACVYIHIYTYTHIHVCTCTCEHIVTLLSPHTCMYRIFPTRLCCP